ncbi:hypothetical protein L210DRAFT_3096451 [Boletus edulis BED1]|uniref:Uncharacterized protein n=1 Tax=Boletus edulis BED1 TaxID=1328754 RepID=A0AAD4GGM9_BOLED|nr:hypothetical protein L210DRAFT_3096451 [Boletus edulis BED1]
MYTMLSLAWLRFALIPHGMTGSTIAPSPATSSTSPSLPPTPTQTLTTSTHAPTPTSTSSTPPYSCLYKDMSPWTIIVRRRYRNRNPLRNWTVSQHLTLFFVFALDPSIDPSWPSM